MEDCFFPADLHNSWLFRFHFVRPREDESNREAEDDEACHEQPGCFWKVEGFLEEKLRARDNGPANHEVDYSDVVDFAPS